MKKDNLISLQNKAMFISKQRMQIEALKDDAGMLDVMKDANTEVQKNQQQQEDLREQIEIAKENEMEQKMNAEMMNEMMADEDDDELDDELAAFEQDIANEMDLNFQ